MPDPYTKVPHYKLDLGGAWTTTPLVGEPGSDAGECRVLIEGTFAFDRTGEAFDAVYRLSDDGTVLADRAHDYLQWQPVPFRLAEQDSLRHRYVFRVPAGVVLPEGECVSVRVNVDRFVDQTLLTPSEVKADLSGDLTLSVLRVPLALPRVPWGLYAGASVPAALALGGTALVLRRRLAFAGLDADLLHALGRIEQQARTAQHALGRTHKAAAPQLPEHFAQLARGAHALARQSQNLRNAQRLLDRRAAGREIGALERRLAAFCATNGNGDEPAGVAETRATLEEKRKALARLDEMKQAEEVCGLRLAKIEAMLESAALTLRSAHVSAQAVPSEEVLRRDLDAEVNALHEVERDLAARKCDQAELLHLLGRRS